MVKEEDGRRGKKDSTMILSRQPLVRSTADGLQNPSSSTSTMDQGLFEGIQSDVSSPVGRGHVRNVRFGALETNGRMEQSLARGFKM